MKFIPVCCCLLMSLLLACTEEPLHSDFPIIAWHGPDDRHSNESTFMDLRLAGFSINFSPYQNREINLRLLELALKTGIKLMISDSRIDVAKISKDSTALALVDSVVRDYRAHPALFGYYIVDEPSRDTFETLAKIVNRFRATDSLHVPYINLFPSYATPAQLGVETYADYVEQFIKVVHPLILSFDHYPILDSGLREDYFENLETIRKNSLKYKVPFWGFTLSVPHGPYPVPHQGHLRFQLYCNLAYGAKGLQYFTYATPISKRWEFHDAILDTSGERTPTYFYARIINNEIRAIATILQSLHSVGVYHSTPVPKGCQRMIPELPIQLVKNGELVLGFFQDKINNMYVMIVNRNYQYGEKPTLYFADYVLGLSEVSKNTTRPEIIIFDPKRNQRKVSLLFKAGEGRLFKIHQ